MDRYMEARAKAIQARISAREVYRKLGVVQRPTLPEDETMTDENGYTDMGGVNANRLGRAPGAKRALDELKRKISKSLDEWTIDPAEPVEDKGESHGD